MKIKPIGFNIYLDIDSVEIKGLDTSATETAVEEAKVIAVGSEVKSVKVGDKVLVKSWSIDICQKDGKKYRFIDERTGGIKCTV